LPSLVDASGRMAFLDRYEIWPSRHSVADPGRVRKRYVSRGLLHLVFWPVGGLACSCLLLALSRLLQGIEINPNISPFIKIGTSMLNIFCFFGGFAAFPFALCLGVWHFIVYSLRPNMSTPPKAIASFLRALSTGLFERAYDLLTDEARHMGRVDLPKMGIWEKKLPDLDITDLVSFGTWWRGLGFNWKPDWSTLKEWRLADDLSVLQIAIVVRNPERNVERTQFDTVFPLVKREGAWFIAKPFFWPLVG